MNVLLTFADRHTLATGTVGMLSGALAWLLKALHIAASVAADLAILLSCAASWLTVMILWRKWRRNRQQRRRHESYDLEDDGWD